MDRILLLAATALLALPLSPPSASAGRCDGDDWGWGEVEDWCTFTCARNEWLGVMGSVDDEGFIRVTADCGGMSAICFDDDGGCEGTSPEPTPGLGGGLCEGFGHGGFFTRIAFSCWTQSAGSGDDPLDGIVEISRTFTPPELPIAQDATGLHVVVTEGVPVALACAPARGCAPAPVACELFVDLTWTCRAG